MDTVALVELERALEITPRCGVRRTGVRGSTGVVELDRNLCWFPITFDLLPADLLLTLGQSIWNQTLVDFTAEHG